MTNERMNLTHFSIGLLFVSKIQERSRFRLRFQRVPDSPLWIHSHPFPSRLRAAVSRHVRPADAAAWRSPTGAQAGGSSRGSMKMTITEGRRVSPSEFTLKAKAALAHAWMSSTIDHQPRCELTHRLRHGTCYAYHFKASSSVRRLWRVIAFSAFLQLLFC